MGRDVGISERSGPVVAIDVVPAEADVLQPRGEVDQRQGGGVLLGEASYDLLKGSGAGANLALRGIRLCAHSGHFERTLVISGADIMAPRIVQRLRVASRPAGQITFLCQI